MTFAAIAVIAGFFFQNCGKAGFESDLSLSGNGLTGGADARFKSAPVPNDINVNTVSYMSCPQAGGKSNSSSSADPLASPYYTFRVGAYDNSVLPTVNPATGNRAGINFTSAAMSFVQASGFSSEKEGLRNYMVGSKYTLDKRAVVALLAQNRTQNYYAYTAAADALTDVLSLPLLATEVANQDKQSNGTTKKVSYFPSLDSRPSVLGSISIGANEADAVRLRSQMNNHYLMIGTTSSGNVGDAAAVIRNLDSPDGDVSKRVYGRALSLTFRSKTNTQWPTMASVREFSLNPSSYTSGAVVPEDLSTKESQQWSCFSLTITREIDRKYYIDTSGVIVQKTKIRAGTTASTEFLFMSEYDRHLLESKMYNYYAATATPVISGVIHKACPAMNPARLDPNSTDYDQAAAERYIVARRFLTEGFWDVNTESGYNCAVPTAAARSSGYKCTESGDDDPKFYLIYPPVGNLADPILNCGALPDNECAPFVSFCYRTQ